MTGHLVVRYSTVMFVTVLSISAVKASELVVDGIATDSTAVRAPQIRGHGPTQTSLKPKLLDQGEEHYQSGRYVHAIELFGMVAAMTNHPFAWLRIGNIWHRRGNAAMALDAYRRASDLSAASHQHRKLWTRAMMNMTLLGIDQAKQSAIALGPAQNEPASVRWGGEIRLRLQELQRALPNMEPLIEHGSLVSPLVADKPSSLVKRRSKTKNRDVRGAKTE